MGAPGTFSLNLNYTLIKTYFQLPSTTVGPRSTHWSCRRYDHDLWSRVCITVGDVALIGMAIIGMHMMIIIVVMPVSSAIAAVVVVAAAVVIPVIMMVRISVLRVVSVMLLRICTH